MSENKNNYTSVYKRIMGKTRKLWLFISEIAKYISKLKGEMSIWVLRSEYIVDN